MSAAVPTDPDRRSGDREGGPGAGGGPDRIPGDVPIAPSDRGGIHRRKGGAGGDLRLP